MGYLKVFPSFSQQQSVAVSRPLPAQSHSSAFFFFPLDFTGRLERRVSSRLAFFVSSHWTASKQCNRRMSRQSEKQRPRRTSNVVTDFVPRETRGRNSAARCRCELLSSFARTRRSVTITLARPLLYTQGPSGREGLVCFSCARPPDRARARGLA